MNPWDAALVSDVIDKLERREATLLAWGVVDGGFSTAELDDVVEQVLSDCQVDGEKGEFIDWLQHAGLIVCARERRTEIWRTRSGETIRLLARLRQLFPPSDELVKGWNGSPSLVSDFRYMRRPRSYPRRHLTPEQCMDLVSSGPLAGLRRELLMQLLDSSGRRLLLADFQLRAARQILGDLDGGKTRGVIIGAGTGSGKTLAFYLPTLAYVGTLVKRRAYWTKALALYPRTELLRDQFQETYHEARRLDQLLRDRVGRKLVIGAYYGGTPWNAAHAKKKWQPSHGGFRCPYMACPRCGQQLVWLQADLDAGDERLACVACDGVVERDEIVLTREQMEATPPDVLFTTTEMLNQHMADSQHGHVFGVGASRSPKMMLLDEVHTYEGASGAQVGMLLRRWHHRVGSPIEFVGLSATLRDASTFFAQLTGLAPHRVAHVKPEPDEMATEGAEYLLALRSDPVSGANVLSTTIQTAMLLTRSLDPKGRSPSEGLYGQRTFVFTDALDVTNRLFFDLADAEGFDSWGNAIKPSLATLRDPTSDPSVARRRAGQCWDLPAAIGHNLGADGRLQVGRTSSQDMGVDAGADVIVATASLEVGFNDPTVGAVIQHKAPRGVAAFLQRKGRAGRPRLMRPWTVVVLSDYGRDRDAYQAYDLLFDPELEPRYLPVRNHYVLRMHAVQAFLDWAASRLSGSPKGSLWSSLASPAPGTRWGVDQRARQVAVAKLITDVFEDPNVRGALRAYVMHALAIDGATTDELLWGAPRPLLLGALPTLYRRIASDWQVANPTNVSVRTDNYVPNNPLPEFLSGQLFSPLELPEVRIGVPPQTRRDEPTVETMPVIQALKEFAPGRVSRRFGINNTYNRHWLAVGDLVDAETQVVSIDGTFEFEELGTFPYSDGDDQLGIAVVRPQKFVTSKVPKKYRDSSNAFLRWQSQLVPDGVPVDLELPAATSWSEILVNLRAYMHSARSHVLARRFALGSDAEVRHTDGSSFRSFLRFGRGDDSQPVAVGTVFNVDALRLEINVPDLRWLSSDDFGHVRRGFRAAYFRHCFETDPVLAKTANQFQRPWLHDLLMAAVVTKAVEENCSLREAFVQISDLSAAMRSVLEIVLRRTLPLESLGLDVGEDDEGPAAWSRLRELCGNATVIRRVRELAPLLWQPPSSGWIEWARERFKVTLGNAVLSAAQRICPEFAPDELILDVDAGPTVDESDRKDEVWISETTIGGAGFIEMLVGRVANDPRRFLMLMDAALRPSDSELVDSELRRFLSAVDTDIELKEAIAQYRSAASHSELKHALDRLLDAMRGVGVSTTHAVVAAACARLLRPGSNAALDSLVRDVVEERQRLEEEFDVEIDGRIVSYLASASTVLDQVLEVPAAGDRNALRQWRFDAIYSLLWARGWAARARGLESYNQYTAHAPTDRYLVVLSKHDYVAQVDLASANWLERCRNSLMTTGSVVLRADASAQLQLELAHAVTRLMVEPIDVGFVFLHPSLVEIRRLVDGFHARFELREIIA